MFISTLHSSIYSFATNIWNSNVAFISVLYVITSLIDGVGCGVWRYISSALCVPLPSPLSATSLLHRSPVPALFPSLGIFHLLQTTDL